VRSTPCDAAVDPQPTFGELGSTPGQPRRRVVSGTIEDAKRFVRRYLQEVFSEGNLANLDELVNGSRIVTAPLR
jgi:hypothetical protein